MDNIFTNAIDTIEQTISGTLLTDIIDHKSILISGNDVQYKERILKYKKIEVRDNLSMTNFIYRSLDANPQFNPDDNYEIFERLQVHARKNIFLQRMQTIEKNIHKLNKWMTNGILKSINTKDILYLKNWSKQVIRIMMSIILLKPILIPINISCEKK